MNRLRQLDVLRAVAVLLVVGNHLSWHPVGGVAQLDLLNPYWFLARAGWTGVDLFFCLSGFLISGLMFREYQKSGRFDVRRFLLRRGFKIYPGFYLLLAVTIVGSALEGIHLGWQSILADLAFVQDYSRGTWGHLWSLGIEEQFYLLLALGFWAATRSHRRNPFRHLPYACLAIAVGCMGLRAGQFHRLPFDHYSHMRPFHLRFDALSFGVLLRYLKEFRPDLLRPLQRARGRWLLAFSLACLSPAIFFEQSEMFMYVFGLTLLYVGFGGILLYSLSVETTESAHSNLLGWIGQSSYSIYLWHIPVAAFSMTVLQGKLHWARDPLFFTYVILSLLVGIGMAHAVEYPVLQLRERLFPERGNRRPVSIAKPERDLSQPALAA